MQNFPTIKYDQNTKNTAYLKKTFFQIKYLAGIAFRQFVVHTLSEKMVLSRTKKGSSANALLEPLKSSK